MNTTSVDLGVMMEQLATLASQLLKYAPAAAMGAGLMMGHQDGKADVPEEVKDVTIAPPVTPPSQVIASPVPIESPGPSPMATATPSATATATPMSMASSSPSSLSEQPLSPSPMASALMPPEPPLQDRPAARYGSPCGSRELVWDPQYDREPSPEENHKVTIPIQKRKLENADPYSLEFLAEEMKTGFIKRRTGMTPAYREYHLAAIGARYQIDMSKQELTRAVKEINEAPAKLRKLQAVMAEATTTMFLAEYAKAVRETPRH